VDEGSVGAGTGTIAFGFKGGIGTASRRLPAALGGYTVGVLVQSNFGGVLTIDGAPVGVELGRYYLKDVLDPNSAGTQVRVPFTGPGVLQVDIADGSIMMVVATDAPVDHRNLMRLAQRAMMGLGRTGSAGSGDSGDYVIAFSTAPELRIQSEARLHPGQPQGHPSAPVQRGLLDNDAMSPLFLGVIEATEEAIYNSLFRATTTTGKGHTVEALPVKETLEILREHGLLDSPK